MRNQQSAVASAERVGMVLTAVVVVSVAVLAARWISAGEQARRQQAKVATYQNAGLGLLLEQPSLVAGQVTSWAAPEVAAWRSSAGFSHQVAGRLTPSGRRLAVRPWLFTTVWIPQPVAEVGPDGRFRLELLFDPNYHEPLVICLEVEDLADGRIIGSSTYFIKDRAGRGGTP